MKVFVLQQSFKLLTESFINSGSRNPATCDMKFFATIFLRCKIWIWMFKLASVYLISMFCSCSTLSCLSQKTNFIIIIITTIIIINNNIMIIITIIIIEMIIIINHSYNPHWKLFDVLYIKNTTLRYNFVYESIDFL